jgi:hypothetical protein
VEKVGNWIATSQKHASGCEAKDYDLVCLRLLTLRIYSAQRHQRVEGDARREHQKAVVL